MNLVARSTLLLTGLASASLVFACGSAPEESVGSARQDIIAPKCATGWAQTCTDDTIGGKPICGPCEPIDGYYTFAQQSTVDSISLSAPDSACQLLATNLPVASGLEGLGCTKGVTYRHDSAGTAFNVFACLASFYAPNGQPPATTTDFPFTALPAENQTPKNWPNAEPWSRCLGDPNASYVFVAALPCDPDVCMMGGSGPGVIPPKP